MYSYNRRRREELKLRAERGVGPVGSMSTDDVVYNERGQVTGRDVGFEDGFDTLVWKPQDASETGRIGDVPLGEHLGPPSEE
jgi:hypothetical protein